MNFTFGIITGGNNESNINIIIDSIEKENIPIYEIIIVGGNPIFRQNTKHIPFDESLKRMWITKKKNLITQNSSFENIVYLHDYIKLNEGWYQGHLKHGNDFTILMDRVLNLDGSRFRDWSLWAMDVEHILQSRGFLIPYDMKGLSKWMYISGAYWVAKKTIMEEFPLDEKLSWGESEDVEWSKRVREKYEFQMNINSSVQFMKNKSICEFFESSPRDLYIIKNKLL